MGGDKISYLGKSVDVLKYTVKITGIDGIKLDVEFESIVELEAFFIGYCYGFNYTEIKRTQT